MSNLRFKAGKLQPVPFEVWVRALANELSDAPHSYTRDTPGSFSEATAFLVSDEVLAPAYHAYPALYLLSRGGVTESYLAILYEVVFRGHTAETQVFEDELTVHTSITPDEDHLPGVEEKGDQVSFAGVLSDGRHSRLAFHDPDVYVRELAARNLDDLRRIYERICSTTSRVQ
ncbi:MAG: hypothetical protein ACFB50_15710 [Rubrobacteraceae bacterium]